MAAAVKPITDLIENEGLRRICAQLKLNQISELGLHSILPSPYATVTVVVSKLEAIWLTNLIPGT